MIDQEYADRDGLKFRCLYQKLNEYHLKDFYPFHMPGHKRNPRFMDIPRVTDIDITEIDGFDNLHHAIGIIKEAQERAARVCHADRTWFLVNGSTSGLISAIFACTSRSGRILMARNCHKAVYNAVELNGLNPVYLYPVMNKSYGIYEGIDPERVKMLLEKYNDIQAVIITSPTFEGVVSDIKRIAKIVHEFNIPLIVDEAHGAHFGYSDEFPESAVTCGADLVIQSLHKTLPSMTQTAVLHQCNNRVDEARVQKYLAMFQSSSPSYVMMAGMDKCMDLMEQQADVLFADYAKRLSKFRKALACGKDSLLTNIRLLDEQDLCTLPGCSYDPSKLVFYITKRRNMGQWLYEQLLDRYHLQFEMASADYLLGMTSICDTDDGFKRLLKAIIELDAQLESFEDESTHNTVEIPIIEEPAMNSCGAQSRHSVLVPRENALGRISKEYLYVYPPGIPFAAPGEIIEPQIIELIAKYQSAGLEVQGGTDAKLEFLRVLDIE